MMEHLSDILTYILIAAFPVIFAITLHEAAHGYAARYFGDSTAWAMGRISLNPLRHIDPVGTLLVPSVVFAMSHFAAGSALLFGWAKPVPVNFGRLRHPKRDMLWVAAAGPAVNLLMAFAWATLVKLTLFMMSLFMVVNPLLLEMCVIGIHINLALMVLNLLPLPPLDGGRIAVSLLPYRLAVPFSRLERWGFPILLLLLFVKVGEKDYSILSLFIHPFITMFMEWILFIFQI